MKSVQERIEKAVSKINISKYTRLTAKEVSDIVTEGIYYKSNKEQIELAIWDTINSCPIK